MVCVTTSVLVSGSGSGGLLDEGSGEGSGCCGVELVDGGSGLGVDDVEGGGGVGVVVGGGGGGGGGVGVGVGVGVLLVDGGGAGGLVSDGGGSAEVSGAPVELVDITKNRRFNRGRFLWVAARVQMQMSAARDS